MRFINILKPFTTLVTSYLLVGCAIYQPGFEKIEASAQRYSILSIKKNITYSLRPDVTSLDADLYIPDRDGKKPVVITIHGGGWSGRSRTDMDSIAEKLAERGYAVFNISYHFAPEYKYPIQLNDVRDALRWVDQIADTYNLDRTRINTWGYSSGAHLAALVAGFTDPSESLPTIRSVVTGGIPADLSVYGESPIIIPFIGAPRDEMPDIYREASPINHISASHPPVFLYHGKTDSLVEHEQSINYQSALQAKGIETELYLHRIWGHFAMFLFGFDAENKAIDFLDYHNVAR